MYLDDSIIFSQTPSQNIEKAATRLKLVKSAEPTFEKKERFFFAQSVNYLGYMIQSEILKVAARKRDVICVFEAPENIRKLRSNLSLCNVYQLFASNFSSQFSPPSAKLQRGEAGSCKLADTDLEKVKTAPILELARRIKYIYLTPTTTVDKWAKNYRNRSEKIPFDKADITSSLEWLKMTIGHHSPGMFGRGMDNTAIVAILRENQIYRQDRLFSTPCNASWTWRRVQEDSQESYFARSSWI